MRLFIAEKPSLARAIAGVIGEKQKKQGYIECKDDNIVTWCFGHLLEQAEPHEYDPKYKKWRADTLPIIPNEWKVFPKKDKGVKEQINLIKRLCDRADSLVNAGDPDREGQLLVDEVLEFLGVRKKCDRIWLASLDDKSVKKALGSIFDNGKCRNLRDAALARSRADWLIGMNLTRAFTLGGDSLVSVGRVQTPTLSLVVKRDREIENFVPKDYFIPTVFVKHKNGEFKSSWLPKEDAPGLDENGLLIDRKVAGDLIQKVKDASGNVVQVSNKEKSKAPPLPHNLSSLQKTASDKLGFKADETLRIAQGLYEKQLTSYPRTDCRYLPEEQFGEAGGILSALSRANVFGAQGANPDLKSLAWNTKKITAHHAIIPTGEMFDMSDKDRRIYDLIALAYIQQFYPNQKYITQNIIMNISEEDWKATGQKIIDPGWTTLTRREKEEPSLPEVQKGDGVKCIDTEIKEKKTQPPARFTDGSLIEAMGNIHKFVEDQRVKKKLKENAGIGTEATRAGIIETLVKREYLSRQGKKVISTDFGREIVDQLPAFLKDPGTTALWEDKLEDILNGSIGLKEFMDDQTNVLPKMVDVALKTQIGGGHNGHGNSYKCPLCEQPLKRMQSKKNKKIHFWVCQSRTEGHIFSDENGKPGKSFDEINKEKRKPTRILSATPS